MKKITIAIPTFNRLELVKKMAQSLFMYTDLKNINIRIYDDCSTEYGIEELQQIFPMGNIYRHEVNKGADYNMWYLYSDFLKSDDEIFFNADSDILFSDNWLEKALLLLEKTDGCLSLFNTNNHLSISDSDDLVEKIDVGAAGTIFRRDILEKIISRYSGNNAIHFDFQWCNFLRSEGFKIYATKKSLVQHIGFTGKNSGILGFDYGDGFVVDSVFNGQAINDAVEEYYKKLGHKNFMRQSLEYRIGYMLLWPFRIPKRIIHRFRYVYKDRKI